ncbi:rhodanese-like domain-containing protein [Nonomuraea lactucae]|uniref:rhodanese-like domain-containing protein n=1 Tax=Nonomuraea lactucae TaxID=2249762 RepID=UPI000DE34707|nr:rhodanese-like domain-containing protein [Nonomuraea lactucae]
MDRVTREDLLALLERGAVRLVEALPDDAFAAEHIPGARNVPGQLSAEALPAFEGSRVAVAVGRPT